MTSKILSLYLNRPRNILKLFGLWLPSGNHGILHKIYMLYIMWTQYSFVLFEFVYIAGVWGDIDAMSEASYLLFTQAAVCYKTTVFLVNKKNLVKLLDFMECETFAPQSKKHEKSLSVQARKIHRLSMFFLMSALITCTLWAVMPLFDNAETRSFPFKIWMPVSPQVSPHYEIGYVSQMTTIYISGLLFMSVDGVTLSMIMFGCAQIEIIMDKIQKIQYMPLSTKLKPENRIKYVNEKYKLFVECIKQHQCVIRFIEIVEDTYHANIFFQLSGTVAIICIIGLRITIVEPNSLQFYSMLTYMVTMLSQLFFYCWCGNELTIRSEELRDLLYKSPWYELGTKFTRSLCITMECMKKPIIFKAGHYIPLSRATFISILRSSYSYFAVLNQANNK